MKSPQKAQNQWQSQSFLTRHWDAALFGVAAATCVATDAIGFDPWVKSALLSGGCFVLAAEQYLFQKKRHTLTKSVFIAAMVGSVATHTYQDLPAQQKIQEKPPVEIAPPSKA